MRKWFGKLRGRLILGSLVPVLLFLGTGLVAFLTIQRLLDTLERERRTQAVLARAYDLKAAVATMESVKRGYYLTSESDRRKSFRETFDTQWGKFREDAEDLRLKVAGIPDQARRLDDFDTLARRWHKIAMTQFSLFNADAVFPGPEWQAQLAKLHLEPADDVSRQMDGVVGKFIADEQARLEGLHREAREATAESVWAIGLSLLGAFALAVLIPLQLARGIAGPVDQLRAATDQLCKGNFRTLVPTGPSELAKLMSNFNVMGLALAERESLLRTTERRYQGLMGAQSHLLWTSEPDGSILDGSSWSAFSGEPERAAREDGLLAFVHPEERERVARRWQQCLADGVAFEDEFRMRRHDGVYRFMSCRCVPIVNSRGVLIEWVGACLDVTERKEEEELRAEKDAAEAASRAKTTFLAKMSHELRTPLNAIIGMSKMLLTQRFGPLNAKQNDYLQDVTRAGEHLLDLINDVLDLSRVEAGRMEIHPERVSVGETVDEVLSPLRALAAGKQQTLRHESGDGDAAVVTDRARFKQVLYNFVSNAIKFTPEQGRVTVRSAWVDGVRRDAAPCSRECARGLRMEVEDTGVGIPPEDQVTVWEEFRQASNRNATIEGTGLGLTLVRRLVKLLHGDIGLRSELGRGSTFWVVLPLDLEALRKLEADSRSHPSLPAAPTEWPPARPLALVVEDHEPTNKLLADWLRDAGLDTSSAFDGREGLEQARRLRPQLVLLDLRLPGLDGWQLLTELKSSSETASIPVIIVSAVDERQAPGNIDVLDWFVKPIRREDLLRRLRADCPSLFAATKPLSVLVVDDDPTMRTLLRDLLTTEGLEVQEAESGEAALHRLDERVPDLMLLDLLMPGMDGFVVVKQVRAQPRFDHLPIVIVTAKDITAEDRDHLNGHIQAIVGKDRLTHDKMMERLQRLGIVSGAGRGTQSVRS